MAGKRKDYKKYHLKANDKEVVPIQSKISLNPTVFLFLFILVFLIICLVRLIFRETTGYYEVVEGDNGKVSSYSAFVSLEETVINADRNGFINYLVSEGERIRVDEPVVTIDEKGNFVSQFMSSNSQDTTLDNDSLKKIKNAIRSFSIDFDLDDYSSIYSEKSNLNSQVISYLSDDVITNVASATDEYTFNIVHSKNSGIFVTSYDGYEDFNPDSFRKNDLNTDDYELHQLKSNQEIKKGDAIYKLVTSDSFSIIFQMTEDDVIKYWDATTLKVYFPEIDKELAGTFSFTFASDDSDTRLAKIDFKEYGYLFAGKRITKIQINSSIISGYKIPSTSLTTKDYYVIPKSYMTKGGNTTLEGTTVSNGFNRQVYRNGSISVEYVEVQSYKTYEDYILVDTDVFSVGDILVETNSNATYEIGAQKSLKGVYNINKGYAIFKTVNVLDEMDNGFVIIEKGVQGSVSLYDHIALNADLIKEKELIY